MELNISDYVIYHIKKHWKNLLNELYLDVFNNSKINNNNNTFYCIHIITKYSLSQYFTITLFKISNYTEIFIMLSDHIEGVYKRLYNDKYIINNQNKCLYLTNTLKDNEIFECKIDNINIKDYVCVNWEDGKIIYNNLYKIKKIHKLSKNKLISLIKLNSFFKFGLQKLSKDELIDFIIKYNIKTRVKN